LLPLWISDSAASSGPNVAALLHRGNSERGGSTGRGSVRARAGVDALLLALKPAATDSIELGQAYVSVVAGEAASSQTTIVRWIERDRRPEANAR
jgi:hypothetical protein